MSESGLGGPPLLGVSRRNNAAPNSFRPWQYALILFVLVLGALYSAPNLFQPDPALQIRPRDESVTVNDLQQAITKVERALAEASIPVLGTDLLDGYSLIRVDSDDHQLRARTIAINTLNADGEKYIVALNRASTTPQWLRDLGASPMSLGLDLSGGVHFLLQVNMDEYLQSVVNSAAEGIQDKLRESRIVYVPNREAVDGLTVRVAFTSEAERERALEALVEYQDYQIREET
jgi:preprotein translocase subunit SecD